MQNSQMPAQDGQIRILIGGRKPEYRLQKPEKKDRGKGRFSYGFI